VHWAVLALLAAALAPAAVRGQQIQRDGFEGQNPVWVKGAADATFRETAHDIDGLNAHNGQRSEHLQITVEPGSFVYYQYATRHAPICDEFSASVWVKANRPGVRLLARLVLPHERNPSSLDDHLTVVIRGEALPAAGPWKRLELRHPVELVRQQQALMQATLKRPIDVKEAYIDTLMLNVYTGPGLTEIWIDDLEVGPVLDPVAASAEPAPGPAGSSGPSGGKLPAALASQQRGGRPVLVQHSQDQLLVGGKRFFIRGIRYSDTPLKTLRDAGFNTLWVDAAAPPTVLEEAADLGFWLVPSLPPMPTGTRLVADDQVSRQLTHFPAADAVLAWDVGSALTTEQASAVMRSVQLVHAADPGRPVGGDVWDGFMPYSRPQVIDLVGVHRWPLMTTLELPKFREWLNQRRLLANPGSYFWTWIQTHLPDWYVNLVYQRSAGEGFTEPIGPQPEQIRLVTYTAVAAGCKGLGFWSDRFLADSHQGRDRLQVLALLNQELEMLEPLLLAVDDPPVWIDTSVPEVKAAVLRSSRGVLVLPMWLGRGAQFVPGQSASVKLEITVPQVPIGTQVWEVSPGEVRSLRAERVLGGSKIIIPEFGLTTAVVFTADNPLVIRFQEQVRARRQLAAQWTRDLAQLELSKALHVEQQLEQAGHRLVDGDALIKDARDRLKKCEQLWNDHLFGEAYHEAQRALRPVRILMRAQWEQALQGLDNPVATPYAVSFYTLPEHWRLMDRIKQLTPGTNLLPDGNFEKEPGKRMDGWVKQDTTLDDVDLTARRVTEVEVELPRPKAPAAKPNTPGTATARKPSDSPGTPPGAAAPKPPPAAPTVLRDKPKEGRQCLLLEIKAKNPQATPAALQRTFLAIHSPAVKLPPGTWVQVSGWVRLPKSIGASVDGALLYDSAAGEPFGVRLTEATGWRKFTLYRAVPASGEMHLTMALTGLGKAYFDDVRIEPLVPGPVSSGSTR
jgi:hypothetical protein